MIADINVCKSRVTNIKVNNYFLLDYANIMCGIVEWSFIYTFFSILSRKM